MNRVYQVIWNRSKGVWQAASELSHSSRGSSSGAGSVAGSLKTISAGAILLIALPLHASDLPSGGTVVGGQGSINSSGKTLTVTQSSQNMAINWQDFSIAEGHTVNFNQPNAQAAALNRVTGNNVSDIRGALNANGRVFLVNPNGVMFSSTARVDVGSLVTSTLDISTDDFMAGNYRFEGASANAIINQGNITTAEGGVVAMIAAEIINTGSITTPQGSTLMGAGSKVTLDLGGPVKIEVEEALLDTYIEQGGAIRADGGLVYLTAKAAGELASSVINHTGVTEARTLATGEDGQIMLMGDMDSGRVEVAGTLDASAPDGGDGGFIETSAAKVVIGDVYVTTRADNGQTGEWLIDPNDYTIAASGGDMTGAQLGTNLADTDVTIASIEGSDANGNGDIFVNDDVTWSSGNTLTLNAIRNIEINSTLDASGGSGGKLVLEYGQGAVTSGNMATYNINAPVNLQAGQNFSTKLGNDGSAVNYTVITELGTEGSTTGNDLQGIKGNLSGHYALGADIEASSTESWNSGTGWTSLGSYYYKFTGNFDGLGHSISNLNMTVDSNHTGLFGANSEASTIQNIRIENIDFKSDGNYDFAIGGLIGTTFGTIKNVYVGGVMNLDSKSKMGGISGQLSSTGIIKNSYSDVSISASSMAGGIVGYLIGGIVENSYAIGDVSAIHNSSGGVAGFLHSGELKNSYASGQVSGTNYSSLGGVFGDSLDGVVISNSYYDNQTNTSLMHDSELGRTKKEILPAFSNMADWGSTAGGANIAGYEVIELPYLIGITADSDNTLTTLFENGMGVAGDAYTITNWNQLQNINYNMDTLTSGYHFALSNDLNTFTAGYNDQAGASANTGAGWKPIGGSYNQFNGIFDGHGHTVDSLNINRLEQNQGFFGSISSNATVQTFGLSNINVSGNYEVGGVVGSNDGTINNVYVSGSVSGQSRIGGLVGNNYGTINNAYALGSVSGEMDQIGGLVGSNQGTITNTYASNSVFTPMQMMVGGLVGYGIGFVTNSYYDKETNTGNMEDDFIYGATQHEILTAFSNLAGWGSTAGGASVAGYEVIDLPYLIDITADSDNTLTTLFESGMGVDGNAYTITNWNQLQNINYNTDTLTSGYYFALSNNLGMSTTDYDAVASSTASGGAGWNPIGDSTNKFTGTFDGTGYTLDSFVINRSSEDNVGLFGHTNAATIQNLGITNANVSGRYYVGSIAGGLDGNLSNSYSSGSEVSGIEAVGGVTGSIYSGSINQVYSSDSVTGQRNTGGLVGLSQSDKTSTISNSYSTSNIVVASATTNSLIGGLVGINNQTITNSYASGTITGATATHVGGLTGSSSGTINSSYYNKTVNPGQSDENLYGKTTAEMQTASTFTDWDLSTTGGANNVWRLYEGNSSPLLRTFMTTVTVSSGNANALSKTYDGTTTVDNQLLGLDWVADNSAFNSDLVLGSGFSIDSKNVGSRNLISEYHSGQTGYDIVIDNSLLTFEVTAKQLDVTGLVAESKVYDATKGVNLTGTASISALGQDIVSLDGIAVGEFADKNVGDNKAVTVSGLILTGNDAGNYTLASPSGLTANITPKSITVSGITAENKVYDASTDATVDTTAASGWISGDDVQVAANGTFADKNVGTAKTVNLTSSYSGQDLGNYTITDQTSTAADVTAKAITVSGITAENKVYDASTEATVDTTAASGWISGDDVQLTTSGQFDDKNVGTAKTVKLTSSYSGQDVSNYTITNQTSTTADVTAKAITVSGITAGDKVYDATTGASVDATKATGWISGDEVQVTASGSFADKHAEADKTVRLNSTYSGADADNYAITDQIDTTASITPRNLTVSAHDQRQTAGQSDPELTYSVGCDQLDTSCGLISGDQLTGELSRENGDTVGRYAITHGTLGNPDYDIAFTPGVFEITSANNPPLDNAIQSAQQTASESANPITGSFGSAGGMTDVSLSGAAQSGGMEVVELDGNSSNTIIEGQSSQGIGPLQMFVIDGGISLAEDS